MNIVKKWENSILGRAANLLSKQDRKKVVAVILIQIGMGALDLVAIALVSVLGSLAVSGIASNAPGDRVSQVLKLLLLDKKTFTEQAAFLGVIAATLLISRTFLSIFFTRRILFFLSRRGAVISGNLVSKLLGQPLLFIQGRTNQQTLFALTHGVSSITLGIIGTTVSLISDMSLLLVLGAGLFIVDPIIATGTAILFSLIGIVLYRMMHKKAQYLGNEQTRLEVLSNEKIIEVLSSYRELMVRNRRNYYAREIADIRYRYSDTQAELTFMPNISKYVVETAVILGALLISAIQFILQDASHAVATLSVFLAAGSRIAPAAMRLQQGAVGIKSTIGTAAPTLDLIESLKNAQETKKTDDQIDFDHIGFMANIELKTVSLTYPSKILPAVSNVSLGIAVGKSLAIVGTSGAGKTTLIDLILGVLDPDSGEISISNLPPSDAISRWPGAIAYVPQDVVITNGTIRDNVALGFPSDNVSDERVWDALETAQLKDFVLQLPLQLESEVGERGTKISGGQRQRLGIARAMFTKPKLLVLDEATSSLDGKTESEISEAIHDLKGNVTLVMIAHRLSTVRNSDTIAYMENGRIVSLGTFNEVRESVPDFDVQAKLMGL